MKKVIVWVMALVLAVSGGAYMGSRTPIAIVTATAIPDFDDSLSTAYEMGSETTVQYEMDEENDKYDINVLYRFTATADHKYQIHIGGVADDQDTYVNVNVIDAELNEYASLSTCGWNPENEEVSYQTAADLRFELLGGRTYYVMLTCMSHEYKGTYAGTYDFCMTQEGEMDTGELSEEDVVVQVSADQAVYKKVRVDQSGWYEFSLRREEESEMDESGIWMDVYDDGGNPVVVNEGKCHLEQGVEYDVLIRMAQDAPDAAETIHVSIQNVKASVVSKETECTWVNNAFCEFTAEETEQIIIYSHSVLADPRILVLKDGEEITGNEDFPWEGSENEKDFGVVCSVEKGQTYTFLMDDHNESGDEVKVYVATWIDPEATETPSSTPEPSPFGSAEPTEKPGVTPTVKPSAKPTTTPRTEQSPLPATPSVTSAPTEKPVMLPTDSPSVPPSATTKPGGESTMKPMATATVDPTARPTTTPGAEKPFVSASPSQTLTPALQPTASPAVTSVGKVASIKLTQKKQTVTASWKKVPGATGYQICYSTSKKWKGKKQKLLRKNKVTVKNLKKKKIYYFRVRAYRLEGTKKIYGAWSKSKRIKMKK